MFYLLGMLLLMVALFAHRELFHHVVLCSRLWRYRLLHCAAAIAPAKEDTCGFSDISVTTPEKPPVGVACSRRAWFAFINVVVTFVGTPNACCGCDLQLCCWRRHCPCRMQAAGEKDLTRRCS
jgi:hypothetical protein